MASFSKEIVAKTQTLDYSGVLENISWIIDSVKSIYGDKIEIEVEINFDIGDIKCKCITIDEFKQHAYGQKIDVFSFNICTYQLVNNKRQQITHIIIKPYSEVSLIVNCDAKEILISIATALENSSNKETTQQPTLQQFNTIHDESVNIIGNGNKFENSVVGKHNNVEATSKKEPFWKPIVQMLISNWLWFLIGALLLLYVGTQEIDWTSIF